MASERIQLSDVSTVFSEVEIIQDTNDVPFPQADKFERVVDLMELLAEKNLPKEEITRTYEFVGRQTNYYTDAGRYLGLIDKYRHSETGEIMFCLTHEGSEIFGKRRKSKLLDLIKKILEHQIFYQVFAITVDEGEVPSINVICEVMATSDLAINDTTRRRRATTVRAWIEWIWSQIND